VLQLVVWDVQHGSAIYIRTPNGQHFAVDLGTGSYGQQGRSFSPLLHLKNVYKVQQLDGVIITHPHRDHLDDISNFDTLNPRVLTRPSHLTEQDIRAANEESGGDGAIEKYIEINRRYIHPVEPPDPYAEETNGGVAFSTFCPKESAPSNLNNHCIVTLISYAGSRLLIPGDNERPSWDELLQNSAFVSATKHIDLLIAPHHGRESGFSAELMDNMSPRLTVISDGPFCDSSATGRYGEKTRGWMVHKRSGGTEDRKCVTTRNDKVVVIECGPNPGSGRWPQGVGQQTRRGK
jgi:competence protein ComEC